MIQDKETANKRPTGGDCRSLWTASNTHKHFCYNRLKPPKICERKRWHRKRNGKINDCQVLCDERIWPFIKLTLHINTFTNSYYSAIHVCLRFWYHFIYWNLSASITHPVLTCNPEKWKVVHQRGTFNFISILFALYLHLNPATFCRR